MKRFPVIIDTDPGVDDFFCLAIGCAFKDVIDLKAVTTIGGNNATAVTTRNALDALDFFGRGEIPVAAGAERFIARCFSEPCEQFHGKNGLGNVEIPHTINKPSDLKAAEMIYKTACECDGELFLVPVGPLTNVALALMVHPDLAGKIKKIVLMGGAAEGGNETPYAEANILHDPEAANIVFQSGIPIDMVGLDVTNYGDLPRSVFDPISEGAKPEIRKAMQDMIDFRNGTPMHDAIAIGTLISENYITWEKARVTIELNGEQRGRTICDFSSESPNANVAMKIDNEGYWDVIRRMMKIYS